jgi:hypothetical protein
LAKVGQDIEAMGSGTQLNFIWAGQTSLSFCLVTFNNLSLFSSGSGRTEFYYPTFAKLSTLPASVVRHQTIKQN